MGTAADAMNKPTITLNGGHAFILEDSTWRSLYKDGHSTTVKESPHMFWILLQNRLDDLSTMAMRACAHARTPTAQCSPLPVEDIIRSALKSNSAEWQMLALARASQLDNKYLLEPEVAQLVRSGKTQAIRHRALKLRARLRPTGEK